MSKSLCCTCRRVTDNTLHRRVSSQEIRNMTILYYEKYATCNECGNEVKAAGLENENVQELESVCKGLKEAGVVW